MSPVAAALLALAVAAVASLVPADGAQSETTGAFLGDELPLKVLSVLPAGATSQVEEATTLAGRDAIQIVLSRAAIALGSDWGTEPDAAPRPFEFEACDGQPRFAVPGKFRWAATSIARFDPDIDWPSDLCFDMKLNTSFRSFDGLALGRGERSVWRFTTTPVTVSLAFVRSELASNFTDAKWTSTIGDKDGDVHEVPPDATVYVSFSSNIDHEMAFKTLVSTNPELLRPKAGDAAGQFENCGPRCIAVRPRGLQPNKRYTLSFPQGGLYSSIAGRATEKCEMTLQGLVPFTFPFFYETMPKERWLRREHRFRRYRLYLRHGLQGKADEREKQLNALKAVISLFEIGEASKEDSDPAETGGFAPPMPMRPGIAPTVIAKDGAISASAPDAPVPPERRLSNDRPLEFTLSLIDNATLQLECADLRPNTVYTIRVGDSADVRDGFGQILESSHMAFQTAGYTGMFLEADSMAYFREFPGNWSFLVSGSNTFCNHSPSNQCIRTPVEAAALPVERDNLLARIAQRFNLKDSLFNKGGSSVERVIAADGNAQDLHVLGLDTDKLLLRANRTGLFIREVRKSSGSSAKEFVSVASFGASIIATESNRMLIWATEFADASPVAGAAVKVLHVSSRYAAEEVGVSVVAEGSTNSDGLVVLSPANGSTWVQNQWSSVLMAVVEKTDGSVAVAEQLPLPSSVKRPSTFMGTLITDRVIYRPGDIVHVKGYIRANEAGTRVTMPSLTDNVFALEVQWGDDPGDSSSGSGDSRARTDVVVSDKYGSFSANLTVPERRGAVRYGDIPIQLMYVRDMGSEVVTSTAVVIADPRPPTVALELRTKAKIVKPGEEATIDVDVKTSTYSGAAVEGAKVELTWTLARANFDADGIEPRGEIIGLRTLPQAESWSARMPWMPPQAGPADRESSTGTVTIVTGPGGTKTATLKISELLQTAGKDGTPAVPCEEGDSLEVSARWVGPTREVLHAHLPDGAVRVARSPYTLSIAPSRDVNARTGLPLPGTSFAVFVDLRDAEGLTVKDAQVTVSLHEWDGEQPISGGSFARLLAPEIWGKQVGDACQAKADGGQAAQCGSTVTLPAASRYVVLARATDADGVELASGFAVGKTLEEWKRRPLANLDSSVHLRADRDTYKVGDIARLSFTSPFRRAALLLVWGNAPDVKMSTRLVEGSPSQEHAIEVNVGEECRLGCKLLMMLASPNQIAEDVMPTPVPTSPLLDITLPRMLTSNIDLKVPGPSHEFEEGSIQVKVLGHDGANLEVAEPGAKAVVQVAVPPTEAGAEVCIFVTDKAMLDVGEPLHPHPLRDVGMSFDLTRGDSFSSIDTFSHLASSEGYNRTITTALRRAKLDPWAVPEFWPLRPRGESPAEVPDETWFAEHTSPITYFPSPVFWGGGFGGNVAVMGDIMYKSRGAPEIAEMMPLGAAPPMAMAAMSAAPVAMMARDMDEDRAAPPPPAPGARPAGGGSSSAPVGKAIYVRSKFEVTPLFAASLVAGADGLASIEFALPDNIATFEVRAYVVDGRGAHLFGRASMPLISRRAVSLVPSLPRIVHPGDRFECGVTVTRHATNGEMLPAVAVSVRVPANTTAATLRTGDFGAFLVTPQASAPDLTAAEVAIAVGGPEGPHELVFPFEAPTIIAGGGVGKATLRFSASLLGGAVVDALESHLSVEPPQAPVVVATSMALTAAPDRPTVWPEGVDLPDAMPGSGAVELLAGVGHLPSIVTRAADVAASDLDNGEALAAALLPASSLRLFCTAALGHDEAALAEDGSDEFGMARALTLAEDALRGLAAFTDQANSWRPIGLLWNPRERDFPWLRSDIALNAFALLSARLVEALGAVSAAGGSECTGPSVPLELRKIWQRAVEKELEHEVRDLHSGQFGGKPCRENCYKDFEMLAAVRAALGWDWVPIDPIGDRDGVVANELSMDRLFSEEAFSSISPQGLGFAALAYTLHAEPGKVPAEAMDRLDRIYASLARLVRIQGRTAYIASGRGSPNSAGPLANSVVLLALARASEPALGRHFAGDSGSSLVARLASYVANGGEGQSARFGGGRWASPKIAAMAGVAMAAYDLAYGSTAPNLAVAATSGEVKLLSYEVDGTSVQPATARSPWEVLARPPPPIKFTVSAGKGQVSLVASLTFVPVSSPTQGAVYRGMFVEKIVRRMDPSTGEPVGPPLKVVELGASVVVTIQVMTPDDLSRVTLEDFASGGLEPVDASVAGDTLGSSASGGCSGANLWPWFWWCAPSFYQMSVRPDRVTWSSQGTLYAGTHTMSYQAIAATRGVFVVPPAQAFVNDQPELLGLSAAGTIIVAGDNPNALGTLPPVIPDPSDSNAVRTFLAQRGVEEVTPLPPRACPGGCPHGGVCDLSTGKCGCYVGARYVDGDCPENATGLQASLFSLGVESMHDTVGMPSPPPSFLQPAVLAVALIAFVASSVVCARKGCGGGGGSDFEDTPYQYTAGPPTSFDSEMTSLVGRNRPHEGHDSSRTGPYL